MRELLELAALLLMAATAWIVAQSYPRLPDPIPSHFGFDGRPDGWLPRKAIWLLPLVAVCQYLLLTAIALADPRTAQFLTLLKVQVLALFFVIQRDQLRVALGEAESLGPGVWIVLALIIGTAVALAPR
jgi:uncharacterized membrane protein